MDTKTAKKERRFVLGRHIGHWKEGQRTSNNTAGTMAKVNPKSKRRLYIRNEKETVNRKDNRADARETGGR